LVSASPFSSADLARIEEVAREHQLNVLATSSHAPPPELAAIFESRTAAELDAATANDRYDFTPPHDSRPFFFNMLRPGGWVRTAGAAANAGGVIAGNLRATGTLIVLLFVTMAFVAAMIVVPL